MYRPICYVSILRRKKKRKRKEKRKNEKEKKREKGKGKRILRVDSSSIFLSFCAALPDNISIMCRLWCIAVKAHRIFSLSGKLARLFCLQLQR